MRSRSQRGNSFVEAGLIFLPMCAMYFGILDVSLGVFIQGTLNNATREGVRFAVTFSPTYNSTSCTASQAACILQVAQDNSAGFLTGNNTQYLAVNYYTANNLSSPVMVCQGGSCSVTGTLPQTLSNGKVVTYPNQPGNVVEVAVTGYPLNWMVPIPGFQAGRGINLSASSSDVLGGLAQGATPPNP
jgi:Flp pilus assembly protein TadG